MENTNGSHVCHFQMEQFSKTYVVVSSELFLFQLFINNNRHVCVTIEHFSVIKWPLRVNQMVTTITCYWEKLLVESVIVAGSRKYFRPPRSCPWILLNEAENLLRKSILHQSTLSTVHLRELVEADTHLVHLVYNAIIRKPLICQNHPQPSGLMLT